MKPSKHTCYLVVRRDGNGVATPIGVFTNLDEASDTKDAWAQELVDKGIVSLKFELQLVPFYG